MSQHYLPDDYYEFDNIVAIDVAGNLFSTAHPGETIAVNPNPRTINGLGMQWNDAFVGRHRGEA
jgi:hypothetical protein